MVASHFLATFAREDGKSFTGFSRSAEEILLAYPWPGSVRQLQNVVRFIVVLNDGLEVTAEMLPKSIRGAVPLSELATERTTVSSDRTTQPAPAPVESVPDHHLPARGEIRPLEDAIRTAIETAIDACGGSIPEAADALQVSPSALYRRIEIVASRAGTPPKRNAEFRGRKRSSDACALRACRPGDGCSACAPSRAPVARCHQGCREPASRRAGSSPDRPARQWTLGRPSDVATSTP